MGLTPMCESREVYRVDQSPEVVTFLDEMRKSVGLGLAIVFVFIVLGPAWFTPLDCTPGIPQQPTVINPDPSRP